MTLCLCNVENLSFERKRTLKISRWFIFPFYSERLQHVRDWCHFTSIAGTSTLFQFFSKVRSHSISFILGNVIVFLPSKERERVAQMTRSR